MHSLPHDDIRINHDQPCAILFGILIIDDKPIDFTMFIIDKLS